VVKIVYCGGIKVSKGFPKIIILAIIVGGVLFYRHSVNAPKVSSVDASALNPSNEPYQIQYAMNKPIDVESGDKTCELTVVAEYKITAQMVGSESYTDAFTSSAAPLDLALAWGNLAKPEVSKHITYSQTDRQYSFNVDKTCPVDSSYVNIHSSNNHIIPADSNVEKAINSISKNSIVRLEGYLVNVDGDDDKTYNTASSLSRTDTGSEGAEVFYVQIVKIGDDVYK
jgi:hypothetical protein